MWILSMFTVANNNNYNNNNYTQPYEIVNDTPLEYGILLSILKEPATTTTPIAVACVHKQTLYEVQSVYVLCILCISKGGMERCTKIMMCSLVKLIITPIKSRCYVCSVYAKEV